MPDWSLTTWLLVLMGASAALSLVVMIIRYWNSGRAMRALARENGWNYYAADERACCARAGRLIPESDGPRGKWVERSYSTSSVVAGTLDGVNFDVCRLGVYEKFQMMQRKYFQMTACFVDLDRPVFPSHVFLYSAPAGQSVDPQTAALSSVLGPSFATFHGRTDIRWNWWSGATRAMGSLVADATNLGERIVHLDKFGNEELARRAVVVADKPASAQALLSPAVQKALLAHERDWYFLLYAIEHHLMVLAVPAGSLSQTRQPVLATAEDLMALVRLTVNLARLVEVAPA